MSERLTILQGDWIERLRDIPANSVHCCVTSPPYWGLRDYGVKGQLGLEKTPEEYVAKLVEGFREVRRVLREDATCWINLGDSYAANRSYQVPDGKWTDVGNSKASEVPVGLKPKDLVGIPWRVAFALQADGWYLRSDIIWCLSGGTWLYVRTRDNGHCLMTVKDLARLKPQTVELWNGAKWTQLLGASKSPRNGQEIEIVLRSGERISCTPTHRFPTSRGLLEAKDIQVGDALERCILPESESPKQCILDEDAAWFAGLYLAEGSRSGKCIQISGHSKEESRWHRVQQIAAKFGGSCTRTVSGNNMHIRIYGRILVAILDELITGRTAHDKGFSFTVWKFSNQFLDAMLDGYLGGDGHWDAPNNRWRLGFCRNYNLERDLRTVCARLGYHLVLNMSSVSYDGGMVPTFRGELRKTRNGHHNQRDPNSVKEIRWSRCRNVYDLGVADEPHLFSLASGILTHNSKPNPMPESVTDRPTKAHEYIFLLSKNERYFYDAEAIKDRAETAPHNSGYVNGSEYAVGPMNRNGHSQREDPDRVWAQDGRRNRRTVWTVPSQAYPESHFATFPEDLIKPCILAGTSAKGCCPKCGAPWERIIERSPMEIKRSSRGEKVFGNNHSTAASGTMTKPPESKTVGWQPTCLCCCKCDNVGLSSNHASQKQRSGETLASGMEQETVGGPEAKGEDSSNPEQVQDNLPKMRSPKMAPKGGDLLQSPLLGCVDVGESSRESIHTGRDGEVQAQERERNKNEGASSGDGESFGPKAGTLGIGSSSERDTRRQPNREPSYTDDGEPCQDPHEKATGHKLESYQPIPCTVLDPFGGSGTSAQVALELGRNAITIELNPAYIPLIEKRTLVTPGLPLA